MPRYKTKTRPGLVALYDIGPGNGEGLVLQLWSPHGANAQVNLSVNFTRHIHLTILISASVSLPCRLQGCKNRPAPFPGRMSYKATKPGSVCPLSLSLDFLSVYVVLLTRAPFCVVLFVCSVSWLFLLGCHSTSVIIVMC